MDLKTKFFILLIVFCSSSQATVITFEEFTPSSGGIIWGDFVSQGMSFNGISNPLALGIADDAQPNLPDTGSNTLYSGRGGPTSFSMSTVSGDLFSLNGLLALEGRNTNTGFWQYSAHRIDVVGSVFGGGTISTTLNLDLFAQENDLLDSEYFGFSSWDNLLSVTFTGDGGATNGYSFALDDIDITTSPRLVPEPSIFALMGIGLFGMGYVRRKIRK